MAALGNERRGARFGGVGGPGKSAATRHQLSGTALSALYTSTDTNQTQTPTKRID